MFPTKLALTPLTVLLLAVPCFLLAYAIRALTILTTVAAVLLNFRYARIFSPLIGRCIRRGTRELLPYFSNGKSRVYLDKIRGQIVAAGSVDCIALPFSDIKAVRRIPDSTVFYLSENPVFTIPPMKHISEI